MNAQQNAPISDRFSSLCARVFSPAAAILESEKTLGTRLLLVALIRSMFDFVPGLCIQQTVVFFSAQSLIPGKHENRKSWQM